MLRSILPVVLILLSPFAYANIIFEGYYRIEIKGKHVGFSIARWEQDPATKIRTAKFFVYTRDRNNRLHRDFLVEKFTADYRPRAYDLATLYDQAQGHYQVAFQDHSYQDLSASGKGKVITKHPLPPNAILAAELPRVLVSMKPKAGSAFNYTAVNEDTVNPENGQVKVVEVLTLGRHRVYHLDDNFQIPSQELWVTDDGQILRKATPHGIVTSTLVADADAAIGQIEFTRADLVSWFNEIPTGTRNAVKQEELSFAFKAKDKDDFPRDPKAHSLVFRRASK